MMHHHPGCPAREIVQLADPFSDRPILLCVDCGRTAPAVERWDCKWCRVGNYHRPPCERSEEAL